MIRLKITEIKLKFDSTVDYNTVVNAKINDTERVIRAKVDFDLSECEEIRIAIRKPDRKISENVIPVGNIHNKYVDILLRLEDLCVAGQHLADVTFTSPTEKITSSCFILNVFQSTTSPKVPSKNYLYEFMLCVNRLNEIKGGISDGIKLNYSNLTALSQDITELLDSVTPFKEVFENKTFDEIKEDIFKREEPSFNLFIQETEPDTKNGIWIKSNKTNVKVISSKYVYELLNNSSNLGSLKASTYINYSSFNPIMNLDRLKYRVVDGTLVSKNYSNGYPMTIDSYLITLGVDEDGVTPIATSYAIDYNQDDLKGEQTLISRQLINGAIPPKGFVFGKYIYYLLEGSERKLRRLHLDETYHFPIYESQTYKYTSKCRMDLLCSSNYDKYYDEESQTLYMYASGWFYRYFFNENGEFDCTGMVKLSENLRIGFSFIVKGDYIYYLPDNSYKNEYGNSVKMDTQYEPKEGLEMLRSDGVNSEHIFRTIIKSNMITGEKTYLRFPPKYYIYAFTIEDGLFKVLYGVRDSNDTSYLNMKYLETKETPYSFSGCEEDEIRIILNDTDDTKYQTQLIDSSVKVTPLENNVLLKSNIDKVSYATKETDSSFICDEAYYGDGTSWVKFN